MTKLLITILLLTFSMPDRWGTVTGRRHNPYAAPAGGGNPPTTTDGTYRYYKFTASGSIKW